MLPSHRLASCILLAALPILGTGCLLSVFKFYGVLSIDASKTTAIALVSVSATTAQCTSALNGDDCVHASCTYGLSESEANLCKVGVGSLFLDPVIVQLPTGFVITSATYDEKLGGGPQPLVLQTGLTSIPVLPGVDLQAEPGYQLAIIDLPHAVAMALPGGPPAGGKAFDFSLNFRAEFPVGQAPATIQLKAMFALDAEVNGQTYYFPMLPCTTDFASVTPLTVGFTGSFQDLMPAVATALSANSTLGCNGQVYDFEGGTSTTTVPGSTTTSTLAGVETCGNCLDDDGDGQLDYEDPECCASTPGALVVRRARAKASKTAAHTRLRLSADATGLALGAPMVAQDVVLQVRSASGALCAPLPADHLEASKKRLLLRDPNGTLAGGLSRVALRSRRDGSVRIDAGGRNARIAPPVPGPFHVTVALPDHGGGAQCGSAAVELRQRGKTLRFP